MLCHPIFSEEKSSLSLSLSLSVDGFRKVAKPEQHTLIKTVNAENLEFWHTNFRRGHPELLHLVQRKVRVALTLIAGLLYSKHSNYSTSLFFPLLKQ